MFVAVPVSAGRGCNLTGFSVKSASSVHAETFDKTFNVDLNCLVLAFQKGSLAEKLAYLAALLLYL